MVTPDKTYRMSRQSKIMLSQIQDPHFRGEVKKMTVQAEIIEKNAKYKRSRQVFDTQNGNQGEE
jgi:hypothetical protein